MSRFTIALLMASFCLAQNAQPGRAEIKLDPQVLARYVGVYRMPSGADMAITLENGQLLSKLGNQNAIPIFAESETMFFPKVVDAQLEFGGKDAQGRPTTVAVLDNEGVTGLYHSSEGKEGDAVWGTRGRWVALSGRLGGEDVTLTILDDPKNPGAPTYWHARGYGLFAANPLGQKVFSNGKEELNLKLAAGASATFHYLVVVSSGRFEAPRVEALFKEIAK